MKNQLRNVVSALLVILAGAFPARAEDAPPIEQFALTNGMQVIVLPNHRVPAVSHMIWFKVGSADDPLGKSGLAHFLEHLMFKGTDEYKSGEYADIISRHGGDQNAFTGYDATSYYVNIAKEHLPLVMKLEAARMRGLVISEEELKNEREVIIEERRQRTENNPEALLGEQMNAALFRHHPYRFPVIGWQHEMQALSLQDAMEFHRRYYHPGNAVLIVSGDITAAELKPLAEQYYAPIPTVDVPPRQWTTEPPQRSPRQLSLSHVNVKQRQWERRYAASSFGTSNKEDVLPLFVLSQLIGGGKTSRLYQSLVVEQKLASAVDVDYNGFSLGPADFTITLMPEDGVAFEKIEVALDKEIAAIQQKGFTAADLTRAKTLLKAESVYARDGLTSMARIMGWIIMSGQPADYFAHWQDLIEAVTAAQLQQVAKGTLDSNASVTGYLLPEAEKKAP